MAKGKGKSETSGATPNNSHAAVKSYVKRMASVYSEIVDLTADLKVIADEAKGDGFDSAMLKRWARAIATEKAQELAAKAMMLTTIGEIVEPSLFDKLPPEEPTHTGTGATH